jgi:hypothetical protein
MKITEINIDDRIRELKKQGCKSVWWSKKNWGIFSNFYEAATGCGIGWDINIPVMDYCSKNHKHQPKTGELFMGLKHYQLI